MPNDGHDITVPTRLGAQNAEAILHVVVSDALDEAGPGLPALMVPAELAFESSRQLVRMGTEIQLGFGQKRGEI